MNREYLALYDFVRVVIYHLRDFIIFYGDAGVGLMGACVDMSGQGKQLGLEVPVCLRSRRLAMFVRPQTVL